MLSNRTYLFFLMINVVSVIVNLGENTSCIPNKIVYLSNCSFNSRYSNQMVDNRTISMTVSYSLENFAEDDNFYIKVLKPNQSKKTLIHFNLNLIECSNKQFSQWTSVESSSTLRGEFVRTTFSDHNIMYLSPGITYLRNLTTIDCLTKTVYQTSFEDLFEINFKIESTLNDYCSHENLCYPLNIYQCDYKQERCICRLPFQSYLTSDQHFICIQAVKNLSQCTNDTHRCFQWCHQNSSSAMCICPKEISRKKYFDNHRAYCESRTNGICNSLIQCPLGDICVDGICQNSEYRFLSFDVLTISIIISLIILIGIISILGISVCIIRRQRWKKRSHSSMDFVYKQRQQQQTTIPFTSDYDNIIYGGFRNNMQSSSNILSMNEENMNDTSPFNISDSLSYRPKIVFLGGEQKLTAIYA